MEEYDIKYVPNEFGLQNTGSICYLNSLLQLLISCSSFTKNILANEEDMKKTKTGKAIYHFVKSYNQNISDIGNCSAIILEGLKQDLAEKKTSIRFGNGQESASEALCLLLDMIEVPDNKQITSLFTQRNRCIIQCLECKNKHEQIDTNIIYNYFHYTTDGNFSDNIRVQKSVTENYRCNDCLCDCGAKIANGFCSGCNLKAKKRKSIRIYYLTKIPEIFICIFNIYFDKIRRTYPETIEFPSVNNGKLIYKLVGRVNHIGSSLHSGHYYADCVRKNGIFRLNDSSTYPSNLTPNNLTYMLAYHYVTTT
jgi:ubiquitin C-terminal hydrolase